jgi:hypothetical protein
VPRWRAASAYPELDADPSSRATSARANARKPASSRESPALASGSASSDRIVRGPPRASIAARPVTARAKLRAQEARSSALRIHAPYVPGCVLIETCAFPSEPRSFKRAAIVATSSV